MNTNIYYFAQAYDAQSYGGGNYSAQTYSCPTGDATCQTTNAPNTGLFGGDMLPVPLLSGIALIVIAAVGITVMVMKMIKKKKASK